MAFAPIAAVILARGLLRLAVQRLGVQFFVVALAPVAAVIFTGSLLGFGLGHGGLHILQPHHDACLTNDVKRYGAKALRH